MFFLSNEVFVYLSLVIVVMSMIFYALDNLSIVPPSLFIGGEYDPVRRFIKDYDAYKNAGKFCEDFKGCYIIKDAGHWVQQEKPKEVNKIIKNFLKNLKN